MILSPCSAGRVLNCDRQLCHSAFKSGTKKPQLLYLMAQNSVLDTVCFTPDARQKSPLRGEQMERDFLKVAVFLHPRSTAPLYMYSEEWPPLPTTTPNTFSTSTYKWHWQAHSHPSLWPQILCTMALLQAAAAELRDCRAQRDSPDKISVM